MNVVLLRLYARGHGSRLRQVCAASFEVHGSSQAIRESCAGFRVTANWLAHERRFPAPAGLAGFINRVAKDDRWNIGSPLFDSALEPKGDATRLLPHFVRLHCLYPWLEREEYAARWHRARRTLYAVVQRLGGDADAFGLPRIRVSASGSVYVPTLYFLSCVGVGADRIAAVEWQYPESSIRFSDHAWGGNVGRMPWADVYTGTGMPKLDAVTPEVFAEKVRLLKDGRGRL